MYPYVYLYIYLEQKDCDDCISEFYEIGGCDCMKTENCDVLALIPQDCHHCGDQAIQYCQSQSGI